MKIQLITKIQSNKKGVSGVGAFLGAEKFYPLKLIQNY